jgi:hypothetical protein
MKVKGLYDNNTYRFENGYTMKREDGLTPNGNPVNNRWVLRDENGVFLDFDQYRNDLVERFNLSI